MRVLLEQENICIFKVTVVYYIFVQIWLLKHFHFKKEGQFI